MSGTTSSPSARRNLRLLAAIACLTNFYVYYPVMTLYFKSLGFSLFEVGVLTSIIIAVQVVADVPTGVLADRIGHKASLVTALFLQFAGEVLFYFGRSFIELAAIQVLVGLAFCFMSGAGEALVFASLPDKRGSDAMQRAMGGIGSAAKLSSVVAFAFGGVLASPFTTVKFLHAVAFTAVVIFVAFTLSITLVDPHARRPAGEHTDRASVRLAFRTLGSSPRLRRLTLLFVLSSPLTWYLLNIYPPYMQLAGLPGWAFGVVVALSSVLGATSERWAYLVTRGLGTRRGLVGVSVLPGIVYVLMATVIHPVISPLLYVLQAGSQGFRGPLFSGAFNAEIEDDVRASVLSAINTLSNLYTLSLGLIISLCNAYSLRLGLALLGSVVVATALSVGADRQPDEEIDLPA